MNTIILLVDDEPDILEFLEYNLTQNGFDVIKALDGLEALEKIKENPDLILLDVLMPKMDGYEVCKRIRSSPGHEKTPVIFLTAKSGEADEIRGLELGANDFIRKPISPKKLIARVKSNLRNINEVSSEKKEKISAGPLLIDRGKYLVYINGKETNFPKKEFELLYHLAGNPGKVFTREFLLKLIWGNDIYVIDRTVDVHIRRIREKLKEDQELIETVKGVGYRFKSVE